jgi:hypothetical protein
MGVMITHQFSLDKAQGATFERCDETATIDKNIEREEVMACKSNRHRSIWLSWVGTLGLAAIMVIIFSVDNPPRYVSAHSGDTFGPACGAATIDGEVNAAEWIGAAGQTFLMQSQSVTTPLTATLRVMNSANNLYLGITINDDEFSTVGEFLDEGDGFRIDFDNDHSGSLFAVGDNVLGVNAGSPQFIDAFILGVPATSSSSADVDGGGTADGAGAASRVGELSHFEVKHPLCSGDSRDFCLQPGDVVGFRLEYFDAEADGTFGGSFLYPGFTNTSEADIVIGTCSTPDIFTYLPLIQK